MWTQLHNFTTLWRVDEIRSVLSWNDLPDVTSTNFQTRKLAIKKTHSHCRLLLDKLISWKFNDRDATVTHRDWVAKFSRFCVRVCLVWFDATEVAGDERQRTIFTKHWLIDEMNKTTLTFVVHRLSANQITHSWFRLVCTFVRVKYTHTHTHSTQGSSANWRTKKRKKHTHTQRNEMKYKKKIFMQNSHAKFGSWIEIVDFIAGHAR